jgi:hypothetical protein
VNTATIPLFRFLTHDHISAPEQWKRHRFGPNHFILVCWSSQILHSASTSTSASSCRGIGKNVSFHCRKTCESNILTTWTLDEKSHLCPSLTSKSFLEPASRQRLLGIDLEARWLQSWAKLRVIYNPLQRLLGYWRGSHFSNHPWRSSCRWLRIIHKLSPIIQSDWAFCGVRESEPNALSILSSIPRGRVHLHGASSFSSWWTSVNFCSDSIFVMIFMNAIDHFWGCFTTSITPSVEI